jgi:8-oxo-dGTP diphosphatase
VPREARLSEPIHVVAGVLRDAAGRVLLAQRRAGSHLEGLWEFPGGKLDAGEAPAAGLARELHEELGLHVTGSSPLLRVRWPYAGKTVLLDVREVQAAHGDAHGREGQPIRWLHPDEMVRLPMPPADRPVVAALRLPAACLVTPEPGTDEVPFLSRIEHSLAGPRLVQLRVRERAGAALHELAARCAAIVRARGSVLVLNHGGAPGGHDVDGYHLSARAAAMHAARPVPPSTWLGVSCHDEAELAHAHALGADYVVLGAVRATTTHPGVKPLGPRRFAELVAQCAMPVFGIGGLGPADLPALRESGAFGVAGIGGFWAR